VWFDGHAEPLTADERERIIAANDALAADGVRVLAVAYRSLEDLTDDGIEDELTLIGLVGIVDPPRTEARDAVTTCRGAGVRVVMITGDHPLTARAIARDLGIISDGDDHPVVTGRELDDLDDDALRTITRTTSVFARVSPEHKLRIVEALRADGQVVAMTGDGVNDAPALRRADIGVAMGVTGTDVSKEAADMVLRDDNFATIVASVEEGRVIYDNLRRFVNYSLAGNVGKIIVILCWPLLMLAAGEAKSFAVALLPLQLLWLNLMTDGLLGLAMGTEQAEPDVMRRPPIDPASSIWSEGWGARTVWVGAIIGFAALGLGLAYRHVDGIAYFQTVMFTSIALMQVAQAVANRSTKRPLYRLDWRGNPTLLITAGAVVALQLMVMYVPVMRRIFELAPLSAPTLGACVASAIGLLVIIEAVEAVQRRRTAA
jgi:Ca2+-transporting ATPase